MNTALRKNEEKTNVIYIVFDDMGFGDLGCYGSEIATPNIDALAAEGLRYNNFHATPLCSPTRASLLTGRNHHSVGMATITNFDLGPDSPNTRGRISHHAGTVAEVLKENGYGTFAVGKWHLAPVHHSSPAGPYDYWPLGKGFQRFYGFMEGETDQFYPDLVYDNHFVPRPDKGDGKYHVSEDLVDHARQFITDQTSIMPEKPFFLYLAFGAQHVPHQAPLEYIRQYEGRYDIGWDRVREQRFGRQKELGIIPQDAELPPFNPDVRPWDALTSDEQKVAARFMEIYAGFLTHTDAQIGRLISCLKEIGQYDNTLIVLISDNGASSTGRANGSVDYSKIVEGVTETLDDILPYYDQMYGDRVSCEYPSGWAQVCNTPLRYYKQQTYFGGIRVPLIIRWPQGGIADSDKVRSQFHYITDITPTVYEVLNIQPPDTIRGVPQMPIHGMSMGYTFAQPDEPTRRNSQHFEMMGNRAMIHEGWKAVTNHKMGTAFEDDVWELYDLRSDYNEVNNLAGAHPERLQQLIELWWQEAERYDVLPLRNAGWKDLAKPNQESVTDRNTFTYYGGVSIIGSAAAPPTVNRSYSITAAIERPDASCEGVLVAMGNYDGGYTLYIRNNRLYFEYNHMRSLFPLISECEVPTGTLEIRFVFAKQPLSTAGTGSLYINGKLVGERKFPRTYKFKISRKGLSVGRDALPTVTETYMEEGEYPYGGTIRKVVYELGDDKDPA
ncbi:Arylsulfatase [Paenibacillus konkukensis]|uniref:Arylsulfatase n=1 Tax=Paenibacillus konkukensis TaxID=2020716 RepID=A0ABY4RL29_9BACL|nr:arylsulfatase [Paenibacillus konkukensis]UQZ83217.1 Arylsulfatase [Paenibacillus konkukensis]